MKNKKPFVLLMLLLSISIYSNKGNNPASDSNYTYEMLVSAVIEANSKNSELAVLNMIRKAREIENSIFAAADSFEISKRNISNYEDSVSAENKFKATKKKYLDSMYAALNLTEDSVREFNKNFSEVLKNIPNDGDPRKIPQRVYGLLINKIATSLYIYFTYNSINYQDILKRFRIASCFRKSR